VKATPLPPHFSQRNAAIDILRALTMLLMIFVNDLWTINGYPSWLGHAAGDEDFLGLADTVFPCFLFVVGMSIPYAIEKRFAAGKSGVGTVAHILTRTLALLIMGAFTVNTESGIAAASGFTLPGFRLCMVAAFFLVWNDYPRTKSRGRNTLYRVLQLVGWAALIYLAFVFRDRDGGIFRARWWGILGLIGWAYLVAAFTYLFARSRIRYLLPAWIVLIILCLLKSSTRAGEAWLPLPRGNFLDTMLDIFHIGNGALAALAVGGVLLSTLHIKYFLVDKWKTYAGFLVLFIVLMLAGYASHAVWITSKIQATPPWVFYCSALSVAGYALLTILVRSGRAYWFKPIRTAGTATLTCYLMPYVAYSLSSIFHIRLPDGMHNGVVGILSCIAFSLLMVAITWVIGKISIKLKI
jgi:predicted acyltransferase